MALTCLDWRAAGAMSVADLYAAEADRWSRALHWDTAGMWREVERGRVRGTVHGCLAIDAAGAVAGWTFYILHDGILQIGGLRAASPEATSFLLDAVWTSDLARQAREITLFAFTDAPDVERLLRARGLTCDWYEYLHLQWPAGRVLSDPASGGSHGPPSTMRPWRPSDVRETAALLSRAYPDFDAARPFARGGRPEEWVEYVTHLVGTGAVGAVIPSACLVVEGTPNRMAGVVLTTRLAPTTAHIAQIAVDVDARKAGAGQSLIAAAVEAGRAAGCDRLTLLVSASNGPARRLYIRMGFDRAAQFLSAGSPAPDSMSAIGSA